MPNEPLITSRSIGKNDASSASRNVIGNKNKKPGSVKKYLKYGAYLFISIAVWFIYSLGDLRGFIWNMPGFLGFFGEKHYLLLFQNNYELRPGGGFISAYAEVTMSYGFPDIQFHDSYAIDYLPYRDPPTPLKTFLALDPKFRGWQFRDANFDPDFPTSAAQVNAFYGEKYPENPKFDGIIALDLHFLEQLLQNIGSLTVSDKSYTADNFFMQTQLEVKNIDLHNEASLDNRKSTLGPLAGALISKVKWSPWLWPAVFDSVSASLHQKHILLNFKNTSWQQKIENYGWGGTFDGANYQNFIYLDSANIGGRKADRYMKKYYDYNLTMNDQGQAEVEFVIHFQHLGTYHLQSDLYQGYLRTYVPLGVKILEVSGDYWHGLNNEFTYDSLEDKNSKMIGTYVHLFPGDSREIRIKYQLPFNFNQEDLEFNLIKQAGTVDDLWSVNFQMPTDFFIANIGRDDLTLRDNLATWKGTLKQDMSFIMRQTPDVYPPIVIGQKFLSLNEIEVTFSEAMDESLLLDKSNYAIGDANFIDTKEDEVSIRNIRSDDHKIIIETSGITAAPEERYSILLNNLKDSNGNFMDPNPFVITVVQRFNQ